MYFLVIGDEELMAKLCKEAIATEKWAREHEEPDTERDCSTCELGSSTAFFASGKSFMEIGLNLIYIYKRKSC